MELGVNMLQALLVISQLCLAYNTPNLQLKCQKEYIECIEKGTFVDYTLKQCILNKTIKK